jgi:hypothetical protein
MAEDFRPIGPKYHRAFDDAIAAYRKWAPNAPEPTVSLDHQEITMTFLCDLIRNYGEPMPTGLIARLDEETHASIEPTDFVRDNSYRNGALHLLKLLDYRRHIYRQMAKAASET